jgi:hypothetical protein
MGEIDTHPFIIERERYDFIGIFNVAGSVGVGFMVSVHDSPFLEASNSF